MLRLGLRYSKINQHESVNCHIYLLMLMFACPMNSKLVLSESYLITALREVKCE